MGLFVSTVSTNIALSELGITLTHPATDYRLDTQFNPDEIRNATALTAAILAGTLTWRKTAGGTIETAASYDPDYLEIEQLNTGTQITIDPAQVNNFAATIRSTLLTGLSLATNAAISATDSILSGFGKIQKQISDHQGVAGTTHPAVTTTVNGFMSAADKIKSDSIYFLKTTALLTNTSNTTGVSVSELTQNCVAGKSYMIYVVLSFKSAGATTGIGMSVNGTASGAISLNASAPISNTAANNSMFAGPITAFNTFVASNAVGDTTSSYAAIIQGVFVCSASGTLFPVFRSSRSAVQISVLAGSAMECTEI